MENYPKEQELEYFNSRPVKVWEYGIRPVERNVACKRAEP